MLNKNCFRRYLTFSAVISFSVIFYGFLFDVDGYIKVAYSTFIGITSFLIVMRALDCVMEYVGNEQR